ncbi:hypothetical protein BN938_0690 [Mucinivorans hirudinis]|uniref:Uncharacterized protein n=1 Tax=Mucinivorans hirudinis TaxID=1433126 RepID=A0A060R6T7_9BACT|nr:hypothetical protein BN938_0690 [Mucinivorans hirudinis]
MNFLQDTSKMIDFITLSKAEFLKLYPQITEEQYHNTVAIFNLS